MFVRNTDVAGLLDLLAVCISISMCKLDSSSKSDFIWLTKWLQAVVLLLVLLQLDSVDYHEFHSW